MAREGLNKVILVGNPGAYPELQFTQGGTARMQLRLATTERYMSRSGERQEKTEWHQLIVWGKRAEGLNKFLPNGITTCVDVSIEYRQWVHNLVHTLHSTRIPAL